MKGYPLVHQVEFPREISDLSLLVGRYPHERVIQLEKVIQNVFLALAEVTNDRLAMKGTQGKPLTP